MLQNVFLKVHRNLSSYRTEGDFRNWVARITMNESINWQRSEKRFQADALEETAPIALPARQEGQVRDREAWEMIKQSMEKLNPKSRAAIALRYFEGLSVREIADALDCSEGTVKSIIFRSLRQMRVSMGIPEEVAS